MIVIQVLNKQVAQPEIPEEMEPLAVVAELYIS